MGRINRYQLRDSQHSFLCFLFFFFLLYFKFFFLSFLFIEVHQRYTKLCDSLPSADEDKTYGLQTVEDELVSVDSIPGDRPYFFLCVFKWRNPRSIQCTVVWNSQKSRLP